MTDAEIAEFMGWSQQATDRMKDDPDSFVGRVHRLVAEVRRRERQALGGDDTRLPEPSLNRSEPGLEPRLNRFEPFLNRPEPPDGGDR